MHYQPSKFLSRKKLTAIVYLVLIVMLTAQSYMAMPVLAQTTDAPETPESVETTANESVDESTLIESSSDQGSGEDDLIEETDEVVQVDESQSDNSLEQAAGTQDTATDSTLETGDATTSSQNQTSGNQQQNTSQNNTNTNNTSQNTSSQNQLEDDPETESNETQSTTDSIANPPDNVEDTVAIIETGDAQNVQTVHNQINSNEVHVQLVDDPEECGSTCDGDNVTATNEQTGDNSQNTANAVQKNSLEIGNENVADVVNDLTNESSTGENEIANTLANAGLSTGDIQLITSLFNLINFNVVGSDYAADAYNVVGNIMTDLDLSRYTLDSLAQEVRQNNRWQQFLATNNLTGDNSVNTANLQSDTSKSIKNKNQAGLTNNIGLDAITGANKVLKNGNTIIQTGDITLASNLVNVVNTNIIGNGWNLVWINITGQWAGDLLLPSLTAGAYQLTDGSCGSACNTANLLNEKTGDDSINMATAQDSNDTVVMNDNAGTVDNNVSIIGDSGSNAAADNQGDVVVQTGEVLSVNNILDYVNNNIISSNWVYGIVNVVGGAWSGDIWGVPADGFVVDDRGSHIVFQYTPSGLTTFSGFGANKYAAENTNTGTGSTNTAVVGSDRDTTIANKNDATVTNNVSLNGLSGGNDASGNNGDTFIHTGDITALSNIFNMVNTNIIGNNWTMAIINVIGNWTGSVSFGRPDLTILEVASPDPDPAVPGGKVYYTLTVANQGDAPAYDVVLEAKVNPQLVNVLDTGGGEYEQTHIFWEIPYLGVGDMETRHYVAEIHDDIVGTQHIFNNAVVYSSVPDRDELNNFTETEVIVRTGKPNTKSSDTSNVTDSGSQLESEAATESDATMSGSTDDAIGEGRPSGPSISGLGYDNPTTKISPTKSNSGSVTPVAEYMPVEAGVEAVQSDILQVSKVNDSDGKAAVGDTVKYTITVYNTSNKSLYDVYVYDELKAPNGTVLNRERWELGEVFPYEQITFSYTVNFNAVSVAGVYRNSAWADGFSVKDEYLVFPIAKTTVNFTKTGEVENAQVDNDQQSDAATTDSATVAKQPTAATTEVVYEYLPKKQSYTEFTEQVRVINNATKRIAAGTLYIAYDPANQSFVDGQDGLLIIAVPELEPQQIYSVALKGSTFAAVHRTQVALEYQVENNSLAYLTAFQSIVQQLEPADMAIPARTQSIALNKHGASGGTALSTGIGEQQLLEPMVLGVNERKERLQVTAAQSDDEGTRTILDVISSIWLFPLVLIVIVLIMIAQQRIKRPLVVEHSARSFS